ncbi:TRAP transporter small permease [Jiella sp. M17.18]|uniref:TRAP transporter small permease n=1 Tax=Jiella sp. M17.18 TaxID=3234247 RepID=UPI0034DF13F3
MSSPSKAVRGLKAYFRLLLAIPIAAMAVMMMTTVVDVFLRYVFNAPVNGAYDLVEISLLVSVYFALPTVILEDHAIRIDLVDGFVSPGVAVMLKRLALVATVAVLCFLLWAMIEPATEAYDFGDVKLELGFPTWIIWCFALFGLANSIVAAAVAAMLPRSDAPESAEPEPVE